MSHRTLAGLAITLIASLGQSPNAPSAAAQRAAVQAEVESVVPGTLTADGDWCVGTAVEVVLTAHVIDLTSQSDVTEGTLEWQVCQSPQLVGLPKEDCESHGSARWAGAVISDLSFDPTPSLRSRFVAPVLGWRLRYRAARGSGFKSATSEPFNTDRTCGL